MTTAMEAVSALMTERKKFEEWLATLEQRRAATPVHVYERVHGDYSARLARVLDQIADRSVELRSTADELKSRVTVLESEETSQRDERAEAELRAAVGEFSESQWQELSERSDADIARLLSERQNLAAEHERVREVLAVAVAHRGTPVPVEPPAKPKAAAPAEPEIVEEQAPPPVSLDSPAMSNDLPSMSEFAAPEPTPRGATPPGVDLMDAISPGVRGIAAAADVRPEPRETSAPRKSGGSFDELAFLNSVVDPKRFTGRVSAIPEFAPQESATAQSASAESSTDAPSPFDAPPPARASVPVPRAMTPPVPHAAVPAPAAAPATAHVPRESYVIPIKPPGTVPLFLKDVPAEQAKTLRCQECGAMNYATEWYCERCGGELSAL